MRQSHRLRVITLLAGMLAAPALFAQERLFPNRPVRIVVAFSPGGATDLVGRIVGEGLRERYKESVVIDNRPGGGTDIGVDFVLRSPPDGHTLMVVFATNASRAALKKLPDPNTIMTPIAQVSDSPLMLVVNNSLPIQNIRDLIGYARANSGKLSYAVTAVGGPAHLIGELFNARAGTNILAIPYKGSNQALTDLLGGVVHMRWDSVGSSLPLVRTGKLRAIAVAELARSPLAPDISTVIESGQPDFYAPSFYGIAGPKGIPPALVNRLNADIQAVVKLPSTLQQMNKVGVSPVTGSADDLAKVLKFNYDLWSKVIKDSKIEFQGDN